MKATGFYTLLALLLMAGGVTAQKSDIVFAPLGAEWHYNYYGMFEEGYVNIKATKDTIIDGFNCVELEKNQVVYLDDPFIQGEEGVYEHHWPSEFVMCSGDVVYLYRNQSFMKWFDFGANVGDFWTVPVEQDYIVGDTAGFMVLQGKGTVTINGTELRYIDIIDAEDSNWGYGNYMYGQQPYTVRVIERIGPVGVYLFPEDHWTFDANEGGYLRCYSDSEIGHVSYYWNNCDYINPQYQSLPQENNFQTISVYPNPVKDNRVTTEGIEADEVQVYNTLGQLVKTVRGTNEIDLSGLVEGVYLLRITDAEGKVYTNKITIQ